MENETLQLDIQSALAELNTALALYSSTTGRSAASILAKKGDWISYNLYNEFSGIAPTREAILTKAKAIKWQFRRKGGVDGLSPKAWAKADRLLGGNRSMLGRWDGERLIPMWAGKSGGFTKGQNRANSRTVTGRGAVEAYAKTRVKVWDSAKGKFVTRMRKTLLRSSKAVAAAMGGHIYSRTFVARAMELKLRQGGRRYSAVSWLQRKWKEIALPGMVPVGTAGLAPGWGPSRQFGGVKRVLVSNNKAKEIIGRVTLDAGEEHASLSMESFASGMGSTRQRGIIARVLNRETLGTVDYLVAKEADRLSNQIKSELQKTRL